MNDEIDAVRRINKDLEGLKTESAEMLKQAEKLAACLEQFKARAETAERQAAVMRAAFTALRESCWSPALDDDGCPVCVAADAALHGDGSRAWQDAQKKRDALTAAAPDLYGAVRHVIDAFDENEDVDLDLLRAVLASARGE